MMAPGSIIGKKRNGIHTLLTLRLRALAPLLSGLHRLSSGMARRSLLVALTVPAALSSDDAERMTS